MMDIDPELHQIYMLINQVLFNVNENNLDEAELITGSLMNTIGRCKDRQIDHG